MCAPPQEQRPGGEDGENTGLLMSFRHMFAESRCSETELCVNPLCSSVSPSADSCEFFVQEFLGLILTVSHHSLYELWVAVQLRFGIQLPKHLDPLYIDDFVLGARKEPLGNPLVNLLYEVRFLIQRKVAGELITPIHYVWHCLWLGSPFLWIYLYHPYLVRLRVGKLAYRWVLREQAVPIHSPVCVHSFEQGW